MELASSQGFLEEHLTWSLQERVVKVNSIMQEPLLTKDKLAAHYRSQGIRHTQIKVTYGELSYRINNFRKLYIQRQPQLLL